MRVRVGRLRLLLLLQFRVASQLFLSFLTISLLGNQAFSTLYLPLQTSFPSYIFQPKSQTQMESMAQTTCHARSYMENNLALHCALINYNDLAQHRHSHLDSPRPIALVKNSIRQSHE